MVNKLPCMAVTAFLAEKIQDLKIAVIGDVMLDRYFHGEVKRISPEAPVPVTKINREKSVLGGATNVAANLAHFEKFVLVGRCDVDEHFGNEFCADSSLYGLENSETVCDRRFAYIYNITHAYSARGLELCSLHTYLSLFACSSCYGAGFEYARGPKPFV